MILKRKPEAVRVALTTFDQIRAAIEAEIPRRGQSLQSKGSGIAQRSDGEGRSAAMI